MFSGLMGSVYPTIFPAQRERGEATGRYCVVTRSAVRASASWTMGSDFQ